MAIAKGEFCYVPPKQVMLIVSKIELFVGLFRSTIACKSLMAGEINLFIKEKIYLSYLIVWKKFAKWIFSNTDLLIKCFNKNWIVYFYFTPNILLK